MTTTLPTVLISGASEELTARIEHLVRGQAELSLVKTVMPEDAVNATFKAKLIWIELESDPEGNVALLEHLIESHPNTFFVVSKEDLEPDLVKRTMQIGALDFLDHKGWAAQIRSVVRRIMAKEFGSKPSTGSPMSSAAARPPQRPSSWGSLNSLKVTVPPNSGFKRVEPSKAPPPAQPLEPKAQTAPPAVPSKPAAAPPPPPPEPEEEEVQEELPAESEQPSYETGGDVGYAEGEPESAEYDTGSVEGEVGYAESEGAETEGAYAETEGEPDAEVPFEQSESEPQAEYSGDEDVAEPTDEETIEVDSQAAYAEDNAGELPVEEQEEIVEEALEPDSEPEAPAAPAPAPASKGRWDDLDSIISTSKSDEKKAPSKWGELGNIQTPKASQKETPATPSTSSKWSDLDAIGTTKSSATPDAPAAKAASKWGDLDAIAGKGSTPSAGSKWGDLDALGSKSSNEPAAPSATPSANKWSDLDNIGTKSGDTEPTPSSGNKWGDLDAIGSGGVKNLTPEQPPGGGASGKKWGDLDAIGGPKEPTSDAGKWGNLDALGSKTGAPKSQTKSFIKPKAQDPAAAAAASAAAAKAKWGDLAADPANIDAEPSAAAGGKWGNLDAIGGGIAKSQPLDPPATAGGGAENKWGNLNSIPTPRSAQETGGNWGDLNAIPTPGAAPEPPTLIEGALPTSQVSNESSQKWKAGMSSDISTGARQVGEIRDKLKEKGKTVKVKVGWEKVSILVAAAIVASAGFLSYSFFTYPTPPAEKSMK